MAERGRFEGVMLAAGLSPRDLERSTDGEYLRSPADVAWIAFRGAATLPVAELEELLAYLSGFESGGVPTIRGPEWFHARCDALRAALEPGTCVSGRSG